VDLRTYFVGSGRGQGAGGTAVFIYSGPVPAVTFVRQPQGDALHAGHAGFLGLQPHCALGFSHTLHGQAHLRLGFSHTLHDDPEAKPSSILLDLAK
jgi:hypothetical protein